MAAAGGRTARQRTRWGGRRSRSRSLALSIGGSHCSTRCMCCFRSGSNPGVLVGVMDQQTQRDGPQVCAHAAMQLRAKHPIAGEASTRARQTLSAMAGLWDPSVVDATDTRHIACYWGQDTYGVAWMHAGLCPGKGQCEATRPPPPRSLPPPTYTQEVWEVTSWGACAGGLPYRGGGKFRQGRISRGKFRR